ncbi:MAG TPA: hypothetical protein VGS23_02420 [Thermoplasmata archaeon]|nr:hypothetical protein [Thermoplasmata archaeon]
MASERGFWKRFPDPRQRGDYPLESDLGGRFLEVLLEYPLQESIRVQESTMTKGQRPGQEYVTLE